MKQINYNDNYANTKKQKEAVTIFTWLLNARKQLLNNPKPTSGPTLDAAPAWPAGAAEDLSTLYLAKYIITIEKKKTWCTQKSGVGTKHSVNIIYS